MLPVLFILLAAATAHASPVIQVHLDCNQKINDNLFFFENQGRCTTFPGFGSYQADCSTNRLVQYSSDDCSAGTISSTIQMNTCISLQQDYDALFSHEQSVMYKCYPAAPPTHAQLESFANGDCGSELSSTTTTTAGAELSRLGYNLNECVTNRLAQAGMYQKNLVVAGAVQETYYYDSQCTRRDADPVAPIPVNECSSLMSSAASRFRVVQGQATSFPTTAYPTSWPTTAFPTKRPTKAPTRKPSTAFPTKKPSRAPTTRLPTHKPTSSAPTTKRPTNWPTRKPTSAYPTKRPTAWPTSKPTSKPTAKSG